MVFSGRASIRKSTGELIEFQSGEAPLGTLTQNAVNAGIPIEDIEEKYVDAVEAQALISSSTTTIKSDLKEEYAKAVTVEAKIDILARKLGLL